MQQSRPPSPGRSRRNRKDGKCPKCGDDKDRECHGYCRACHAKNMREWRSGKELNPEQKRKDACRSYANQYKRRGKLVQEPCAVCGEEDTEMHHPDYDKPLQVVWLCRPCHLAHHNGTEYNLADSIRTVEPRKRKTGCSRCGGKREKKNHRYCKSCRKEYMRGWREKQKRKKYVALQMNEIAKAMQA